MFQFKKHIGVFSLLVLMIPSSIQLLHVFENHEHLVCTSVNDQHFHESDVDCSLMHYQLEVYANQVSSEFSVIPQHLFKNTFGLNSQRTSIFSVKEKPARAPPTL